MSRVTVFLKAPEIAEWNNRIRLSGLDPGIADSMDVPYEPGSFALSWPEPNDDDGNAILDALIVEAEARGPANVPGPQWRAAYYDDRELQELEGSPDAATGTDTTAPFLGWTVLKMLRDRKRKDVELVPPD